METKFDVKDKPSRLWPDFYKLLDSTLETDSDSLRQAINKMYLQANRELDHRDLSRRFYFQVLGQKVLPQCRRILLDKEMRQAYNEQWCLHRDGVPGALSYSEFLMKNIKDANATSSQLLSETELSLLPSFESQSHAPSANVAVPTTADLSKKGERPDDSLSLSLNPAPDLAPKEADLAPGKVAASPKKTAFPLWGAVAGLGALMLVGGFLWNSSRQSQDAPAPSKSGSVASAPSLGADVSLKTPILLTFDSVPGIVVGHPYLVPGLDGKSLVFDGESSVELPQTLDTSKSYSVMAWVKISRDPKTQGNYETFVSADGPVHSAFFLQLRGDNNRFGFSVLPQNSSAVTFAAANNSYKANTWYHLAGVYDAANQTISLYVNGAFQSSVVFKDAFRASGILRLGRAKFDNKSTDFLTGSLDNVQVVQKALSGADILAAAKPFFAKAGIK